MKAIVIAAWMMAAAGIRTFDTPQQAADRLIDAAEKFDVQAIEEMFGPKDGDIVLSGEYAQDRQRATEFAAKAREKHGISRNATDPNRAVLVVGNDEWPFPVPIVRRAGRWSFDGNDGRREIIRRRIGGNELDAIRICRGYVEAQHEYALKVREGYDVNQYARRIVSTPGTQDGLAWQNADGTWDGPVGDAIARAIEQGYTSRAEPYHGYFFKVLAGQGSAAPLGAMDYLVKNVMIGGFALVAAPAEYRVTGVKTFIVSHDGVVYQRDLGPATLAEFQRMNVFNPDRLWSPVPEQ